MIFIKILGPSGLSINQDLPSLFSRPLRDVPPAAEESMSSDLSQAQWKEVP